MLKLILRAVVFIGAVFLTAWLLPGIYIANLESGLIVALAIFVINTFIKPIVKFFTFPITLLTLGIFPLILNAAFILGIAYFVDGFQIIYETFPFLFIWAFAYSFLLTIVNYILNRISKMIT